MDQKTGSGQSDIAIVTSSEVKKLKVECNRVKRVLKAIDDALLTAAHQALRSMHVDDAAGEAIRVLRGRIEQLVDDHFSAIEQSARGWYDNLVSKYGVTLHQLEAERDLAAVRLSKHLEGLGYE